ncbi:NTP transferase domain-containing protein [Conexivisphaera calida]|uniref:NTP transferase domain-containing protein n=1 Tax=Conexivisphaera calida TaxID=1874277 RepID=UPI001E37A540|nr:NTP transferase domain-containing protein [Conexivisphaera calida]
MIIMAGGRGSRLGYLEKPLVEVCGRPMVDGVLRAAAAVEEPILCTSPFVPNVERLYCGSLRCVRGSGDYVSDLGTALEAVGVPALVLPADMPFLDHGIRELRRFVDMALESRAQVITLNVCRHGRCYQPGVSVFRMPSGEWEDIHILWRAALMDVDDPGDLEEARGYCGITEEGRPEG